MCSAAAEPLKLFTADKAAAQDEAFAFDRTASRLQDMMSEEYMTKMHAPPSQSLGADSEGGAPLEVLSELHHALSEKEVGPLWPLRLHVQCSATPLLLCSTCAAGAPAAVSPPCGAVVCGCSVVHGSVRRCSSGAPSRPDPRLRAGAVLQCSTL